MLRTLASVAAGRRGRLGVATLGRKRGGGKPGRRGSPEARRKAFLQVDDGGGSGGAAGGGAAVTLKTNARRALSVGDGGEHREAHDVKVGKTGAP